MATPAYRAEGLTRTYGEGASAVHALRGVDLSLPTGEIVVLLGPSGSGKSTLLNILGGLDRPSSGRAWFRDAELTAMTDRQLTRYRRDHLGFIFQFYNLMPSLTAEENVELVTEIARDPMTPSEALELVGLEKRRGHFPSQLSGGEQQRVAIARALVTRPPLLLADEPTGNLDEKTGAQIVELMFKATRERGMTLVLVTHDAGLAKRCDTAIRVRSGHIETVETRAAETQGA